MSFFFNPEWAIIYRLAHVEHFQMILLTYIDVISCGEDSLQGQRFYVIGPQVSITSSIEPNIGLWVFRPSRLSHYSQLHFGITTTALLDLQA